jgi:hypothetical protein
MISRDFGGLRKTLCYHPYAHTPGTRCFVAIWVHRGHNKMSGCLLMLTTFHYVACVFSESSVILFLSVPGQLGLNRPTNPISRHI